jgi:hypothetical protein
MVESVGRLLQWEKLVFSRSKTVWNVLVSQRWGTKLLGCAEGIRTCVFLGTFKRVDLAPGPSQRLSTAFSVLQGAGLYGMSLLSPCSRPAGTSFLLELLSHPCLLASWLLMLCWSLPLDHFFPPLKKTAWHRHFFPGRWILGGIQDLRKGQMPAWPGHTPDLLPSLGSPLCPEAFFYSSAFWRTTAQYPKAGQQGLPGSRSSHRILL